MNDETPPAYLQEYKDTISSDPDDEVIISVKFDEAEIYMYHYHILEHEANGMMGQVQVK